MRSSTVAVIFDENRLSWALEDNRPPRRWGLRGASSPLITCSSATRRSGATPRRDCPAPPHVHREFSVGSSRDPARWRARRCARIAGNFAAHRRLAHPAALGSSCIEEPRRERRKQAPADGGQAAGPEGAANGPACPVGGDSRFDSSFRFDSSPGTRAAPSRRPCDTSESAARTDKARARASHGTRQAPRREARRREAPCASSRGEPPASHSPRGQENRSRGA